MVAIDLASMLVESFDGMQVWTPEIGASYNEATNRQLATRTVPYLRIFSDRPLARFQSMLKTWIALQRAKPAILHAHSPYAYRSLSHYQKIVPFRSIVHVHIETDPETLRWCFKIPPDLVIACAEFLVPSIDAALRMVGARKTKIVVCPNSVDTTRFIPGDRSIARKKLAMKPDALVLLMLANLSPHKGQTTMIQAVRHLRDQGHPAVAYMAGVEREGTGYQQELELLARTLQVQESVHFLGFRKDTELLLQAADFFVLPSEHEGLPLSILEAQAVKIPVLAAPTAGIPEVIEHGVTGYLVPAKDYNGYANVIAELTKSQSQISRVVDHAYRRVVSEHSRSKYSRRIAEIYCDFLGNASHTR